MVPVSGAAQGCTLAVSAGGTALLFCCNLVQAILPDDLGILVSLGEEQHTGSCDGSQANVCTRQHVVYAVVL